MHMCGCTLHCSRLGAAERSTLDASQPQIRQRKTERSGAESLCKTPSPGRKFWDTLCPASLGWPERLFQRRSGDLDTDPDQPLGQDARRMRSSIPDANSQSKSSPTNSQCLRPSRLTVLASLDTRQTRTAIAAAEAAARPAVKHTAVVQQVLPWLRG